MTNSDDVSHLLAAARGLAPPVGSAEAGLARLTGSLAAQTAPMPIAVGPLKLASVGLTKWISVGFLVGLSGAGLANYGSRPEVAAAVSGPTSAEAPRSKVVVVETTSRLPALALSAFVEEPASGVVRAPAVSVAVPLTPSGYVTTFDEELRLITAAKRELDAGRAHLARAWLDEHRQRYAAGVFSLEREGLRVLATCAESPRPELARQFAAGNPASPMLPQLLRRCGAEHPSPAPTSGNISEPAK